MSSCEILLMVSIDSKKSIIKGNNLLSFYRLNFIWVFHNKSHVQHRNLPSCHEMGNIGVLHENRPISEKISFLTLILQGGIAFFVIFSLRCRISGKITRNEKESVVLPDLKKDFGFSDKSLIYLNDLMCFHGMVRNHMFLGKSYNLNSDLMSSNCIVFIYYILRKIDYSMFQINVY